MSELASKPERGVVTIVVVDTVGSTEHIALIDPDDAQAFLDKLFVHIRDTVERAGGLMVSYAGDGGVAVFGWPGAQEDHADRACEAAWEIQHSAIGDDPLIGPDGSPIRFRIGIHSGLVGLRQQELSGGQYLDMVGGTVHLAAALEKRAPHGGILVSSATIALCRTELRIETFDNFIALQKIGATPHLLTEKPYRLSASDMVQRHRLPMLGRDSEREALRAMLPRKGGDNHVAAVIGPPGIGKSRMATALMRDAGNQPISIRLLAFSGDMRKRSTPFAAMRELIAQVLEVDPEVGWSELMSAIERADVQGLFEDDVSRLRMFWEKEWQGSNRGEVVIRFAQTLSNAFCTFAFREPLFLVIEDIHLVDPETVSCLRRFRQFEADYPFFVMLTGRPESIEVARSLTDTILEMQPFERPQMLALAEQLNGDAQVPLPLIAQAVDRSGGVPFVLEQIIAGIRKSGSDTIELPDTVQSVVHAQVNELSPNAKVLVRTMSVLGETVELVLAQATAALNAEGMQQALGELLSRNMIHPPMGKSIQFRHAMIREACANTVGRKTRVEVHRRAIAEIEERYGKGPDVAQQLAYYAMEADEYEKALQHLWNAGINAAKSWASGSLKLIFDNALVCVDRLGSSSHERFVDFTLMAYSPMLQLGEFARMSPHLDRAIELATELELEPKLCGCLCQLGMVRWFEGRYEEGLETCKKAYSMALDIGAPHLIFSSRFMLTSNLHGLGRVDEALQTLLELSDQLADQPVDARMGSAAYPSSVMRAYISWYMMEKGRYSEGLPYAREALKIARDVSDPYTEVLSCLGLGRNLFLLEEIDEAETVIRTGFEIAMANDFFPAATHLSGLLAAVLSRLGRAEEGLRIVDEFRLDPEGVRCGELEYFHYHAGRSEALFALGDHEQALDYAEKALAHGTSINNQCLMTQGAGLLADLHLELDPACAIGLKMRDLQLSLSKKYGLAKSMRPPLKVSEAQ